MSDNAPVFSIETRILEARPAGARATFSLSAAKQQRLDALMEKNNEGMLNQEELAELRDLVRVTEELQLANAQRAFERLEQSA